MYTICYIVFVLAFKILIPCTNAEEDMPPNAITLGIELKNNSYGYYYECSTPGIFTLLQGEAAVVLVELPTIHMIRASCSPMNCNDELVKNFRYFNKSINTRNEVKVMQADIANVESTMDTEWQCVFILENTKNADPKHDKVVCNFRVLVKRISVPVAGIEIKINRRNVKTQRTRLSQTNYAAVGYYNFIADEIITVVCQVYDEGGLKLDYHSVNSRRKTALVTTDYIQEYLISMQVKLREEDNNSYIECMHRMSEDVEVVRIFMRQQPDIIEKDLYRFSLDTQILHELSIFVNGLKLKERTRKPLESSHYMYRYVEGETINVTCKKSHDTDETMKYAVDPHLCLYLRGLSMANTLFQYKDKHNITQIHYEYENNDILNLNLGLMPQTVINTTIIYLSLKWKGDTIWNETLALRQHMQTNETKHTRLINLSAKDDGSPIIYSMKTQQFDKSTNIQQREMHVIPTLRSHYVKENKDLNKVNYREEDEDKEGTQTTIPVVSVGVCTILIIIMILVIFSYRSRKRRTNTADYDSYANLPHGESPIPPFPNQWDQYAEIANRTEPCNSDTKVQNNKDHLYANPIPKSERTNNRTEYSSAYMNNAELAYNQNLPNRGRNMGNMTERVDYAEVLPRSESGNNPKSYANACDSDRYANTDANEYAEPAYCVTVIK